MQNRICYSNKKFRASFKPWTSVEKGGLQSHQIYAKGIDKIRWILTEAKRQKWFFKLTKSSVSEKSSKKANTYNDKKRKTYLASEPNYHTTQFLTADMVATELRKFMNKLLYLGLSILDLSKHGMSKNFGMTRWNRNLKEKQNSVIQI